MINDFMYIGHVVGHDGEGHTQKAVKALPVRRRRDKPRQLEHEQFDELPLMEFVDHLRERLEEDLDPDAQIARAVILRIHKALLVDHIIELFKVAL